MGARAAGVQRRARRRRGSVQSDVIGGRPRQYSSAAGLDVLPETHGVPLKNPRKGQPLHDEGICRDEALGILT